MGTGFHCTLNNCNLGAMEEKREKFSAKKDLGK
jgi:hypothetical protein